MNVDVETFGARATGAAPSYQLAILNLNLYKILYLPTRAYFCILENIVLFLGDFEKKLCSWFLNFRICNAN